MEPSNQFFVSKLVAFAYSYVIRCACLANLQLDRSRCSRLPSPDLGLWTPTHQWWSCDIFFCCSWGRWRDNAWLQTLQPCVEIHVIYYYYYSNIYIYVYMYMFLICMSAWPYSYEVSERRIRGKPQQNVEQIFTRGSLCANMSVFSLLCCGALQRHCLASLLCHYWKSSASWSEMRAVPRYQLPNCDRREKEPTVSMLP